MVIPDNIGPKELHRRIVMSKPVCVVSANSDQIREELFDVIEKVCDSILIDWINYSAMFKYKAVQVWEHFQKNWSFWSCQPRKNKLRVSLQQNVIDTWVVFRECSEV